MSKETYLRFLRAYLTGRLPAVEVEEIMRYYTEYFEDAGEGNEPAVMAELGSPEHLAQQILGQRGREELVPAAEPAYEYKGEKAAYVPSESVPAGHGGIPEWAFILALVLLAIFAGPPLLAVIFGLGLAGVLCAAIGLRVAVGGLGKFSLAGFLYQAGGGLIAVAVGLILLLGAALVAWGAVRLIRWLRELSVGRSAGYEEGC